jgi:hypothetical protein
MLRLVKLDSCSGEGRAYLKHALLCEQGVKVGWILPQVKVCAGRVKPEDAENFFPG